MSISAGLVGLPNVGKSTLFNALTKSSIPAENYPFCTIDPHVACTHVPDERIQKLVSIYGSEKIVPAMVEFVDIAGLVKGAASGEGLGNQFLNHIRNVDLIIHVLRCFEDPDIVRTQGSIDPLSDYETICTELMLKDLDSVVKRQEKAAHQLKSKKGPERKELEEEIELLKKLEQAINNLDQEKVRALLQKSSVTTVPLLSGKKILIIANIPEHEVADNAYEKNPHYQALCKQFGADRVIPVCAKLEGELAQLPPEEEQELASIMGLEKRGLDEVIRKTYKNLGLITFFTCGPKEIHAWPIQDGLTVRQAAGKIHSDLERGFICADVFSVDDLFKAGKESVLKETGKIRTEGQAYVVQDGDCIFVKYNV